MAYFDPSINSGESSSIRRNIRLTPALNPSTIAHDIAISSKLLHQKHFITLNRIFQSKVQSIRNQGMSNRNFCQKRN